MNESIATVNLRKLTGLVVTVRTSSEFRVRVWIATRLVRLTGWILGGRGVVIVEDDK